jgi:dTDP-D-glucose 4,6-dehydratase
VHLTSGVHALNGVIYFAEESNVKMAIPPTETFVESNVQPTRIDLMLLKYLFMHQKDIFRKYDYFK